MAKTDITKQLERDIFYATDKTGTFGCFEVTIGFFGNERVDYLTYDTKGIWRCFEIKTSKSDFYSKAKKTFVGHYNYFVLTPELYEQVKHDIPSHIGVHVGYKFAKKAKKQELGVEEKILKDSLIRSLARESNKFFRSGDTETINNYKQKVIRLERQIRQSKQEIRELHAIGRDKYGRNWHIEEDFNEQR